MLSFVKKKRTIFFKSCLKFQTKMSSLWSCHLVLLDFFTILFDLVDCFCTLQQDKRRSQSKDRHKRVGLIVTKNREKMVESPQYFCGESFSFHGEMLLLLT